MVRRFGSRDPNGTVLFLLLLLPPFFPSGAGVGLNDSRLKLETVKFVSPPHDFFPFRRVPGRLARRRD